jgi:cell division protein FtsB
MTREDEEIKRLNKLAKERKDIIDQQRAEIDRLRADNEMYKSQIAMLEGK